jgi:hypothetical protein
MLVFLASFRRAIGQSGDGELEGTVKLSVPSLFAS